MIRILELITYPDQEGRPNMLSKKLSTEDLQQNFSNLWIDFFWLLGRESNVEIYKRGEAIRTKFKTTRIMIYKGIFYKSKYSILAKKIRAI